MSMNKSVAWEWKVLVSLFTGKIVKVLSLVVSITVHSLSITWYKLWQQFGGELLYWNAKGCTSYVCHISILNVQIYTLLYVGILIERDWIGFTVTLLLVVWPKKKTLQRHCDRKEKEIWVQRRKYKIRKVGRTQAELCFCMQHCMRNFRELVYHWLIYILFISKSQISPAQSMANLQKD